VKNGIKASWTPAQHFFIDAGATYTNFLHAAAVQSYVSPIAGVGWRFDSRSSIRIGYHGDYGNGYSASGADVSLYLSF